MNILAMTPQPSRASTRYCLANTSPASPEFLVYAPSGGAFTVDLSGISGTLSVEWFDPNTGSASSAGTVAGGSSSTSFTTPFGNDAVLYLK
jgi:hypothetical protein